ncbi:MAG: type II toxin-antitoxin system VapC family toxin [Candidatus Tectomicrobia bacterium]|uniref:Type II toxin-antitoxin system VapC family toxin n=1 Tax=Tectimicrobiota bacterium TaxID=2528274 RepID=A0A932CMA2_UNCTE|nr:type II toxin-antitoxin system VapC family toxin [Candidatus Tectomicrobia bacterium]
MDASLALKLVLPEDDSDYTEALWASWVAQEITVVAPYLLAYEVSSVIRNKVYRGKITVEDGDMAFAKVHAQGIVLLHPKELVSVAWDLAKRFNRPAAYDSHYLALAQLLDCALWTADKRLYNTVCDALPWVHCLNKP